MKSRQKLGRPFLLSRARPPPPPCIHPRASASAGPTTRLPPLAHARPSIFFPSLNPTPLPFLPLSLPSRGAAAPPDLLRQARRRSSSLACAKSAPSHASFSSRSVAPRRCPLPQDRSRPIGFISPDLARHMSGWGCPLGGEQKGGSPVISLSRYFVESFFLHPPFFRSALIPFAGAGAGQEHDKG
jgi:hypothetical protein